MGGDGESIGADGPGKGDAFDDEDGCGSRVLSVHCSIGSGACQVNFPTDLLLQDEVTYVVERGNARVQRLRLGAGGPTGERPEDGKLAAAPAWATSAAGALVHPWGITAHEDLLFVTDVGCIGRADEGLPGRVVVLDGLTLEVVGELGIGRLRLPAGVAVLSRAEGAELIVADHGLHQLCCLDIGTAHRAARRPISQVDGRVRIIGRRGRAPGMFHSPVGVAVGRMGAMCGAFHGACLFVSEFSGRRVQALSILGEPLAVFEPPGRSRLMGLCCCVAPDGEIGVWVCDYDADCLHTLNVHVGRGMQATTPVPAVR